MENQIKCFNCDKINIISELLDPLYKCSNCNMRFLGYGKNEFLEIYNNLKPKSYPNPNPIVPKPRPEPQPLPKPIPQKHDNAARYALLGLKTFFDSLGKLKIDIDGKNPYTNSLGEGISKLIHSGFIDHSAVGWLIVHTEGRDDATFPLTEGINRIGRDQNVDIIIDSADDPFVSRIHSQIIIKRHDDFFRYIIVDEKSTNGTYVNGQKEKIDSNKGYELFDGDTIQIGETKLVLKTVHKTKDGETAKTQVLNTDYNKTISILR